MPRKKATETEVLEVRKEETVEKENKKDSEQKEEKLNLGILRINLNEPEETRMNPEEITWNELASAYRNKRIVPAIVTGIEMTEHLGNVVIAYYKEQRIVIPVSEMMINLEEVKNHIQETLVDRLTKICNTMLGAEIDLIIKGMEKNTGSIVASRKEAMLKKREKFYLEPLSDGLPMVREGRIVEGRIIAVTPFLARIEVFGVELIMPASQLSWDWLADVSEKFHVGTTVNILITEVTGDTKENLKISADLKSITPNKSAENISKCVIQGKYIGEITNITKGVSYIRLKIGVNAIAHTNYDKRTPGKGDLVSFVVTRINPDYGNVSGIITKILKQNI